MVQKMRKMKASGIEWIGEIPEGWEVSQLKYVTRWKSEKGCPDAPVLSLYRDFGVVPKDSRNDNHNVTSLDTSNYKVVDIGDLVINKMKAWQGSMAVSDYRGIVSPAYHVCSITSNKVNKRYLHHLLRNPAYLPEYARLSTGMRIGQWDLGFDDFKNIPFLIPPLDEQAKIADYLDNGCASLDAMLSKTRSSIEEYKKLKQAVITQAVTKGVRGERKMKDSGVEWIGEIPVHWKISRIKYVSIFEPSCDFRKLTPETIITYSPMECIKNGTFERRTSLYGNLAHTLTPFQNGDIVMAKVTPCFENGNIAIMNELQSGYGLGSSELFVFRPQNINTRYLFYWLQNKLFVHQACATMTGTGGLKRISPSFVKNCNIHCPSTAEQAQIADYLDAKCAEIDRLIAKKEQLVKELEGYKKSLIYEVVTGKREV